jgi:hypothetical protein
MLATRRKVLPSGESVFVVQSFPSLLAFCPVKRLTDQSAAGGFFAVAKNLGG